MSEELEKAYAEIERQDILSLEREITEKEEIINNVVGNFVYGFLYDDNGNYDEKRLKSMQQIISMYKENFFPFKTPKYKIQFSPTRSVNLAYEFLKELGPEYAHNLRQCEQEETLRFYTIDDVYKYNYPTHSHFFYDNGKNYMNILCRFNVGDVYGIIHEAVHSTNAYTKETGTFEAEDMSDNSFYTWDLFTETMSYFATRLARMYYMEKYPDNKEFPKEYYDEEDGFNRMYYKTDFMMQLLQIFLNKGQIQNEDVMNIANNVSDDYLYAATNQLLELYDNNYFTIINNMSYLLGNIVVNHILANHDYKEAKQIFLDMNKMVKDKEVKDIFTYLDLEVKNIDMWFVDIDPKEFNKLGDYNDRRIK